MERVEFHRAPAVAGATAQGAEPVQELHKFGESHFPARPNQVQGVGFSGLDGGVVFQGSTLLVYERPIAQIEMGTDVAAVAADFRVKDLRVVAPSPL